MRPKGENFWLTVQSLRNTLVNHLAGIPVSHPNDAGTDGTFGHFLCYHYDQHLYRCSVRPFSQYFCCYTVGYIEK